MAPPITGRIREEPSFGADGKEEKNPSGPVMQAADGKLYGTTTWEEPLVKGPST